MNKKQLTISVFIAFTVGLLVVASCFQNNHGSSPEWRVVTSIALGVELYAKEQNGQTPYDWEPIERYVNLEEMNRSLVKSSACPIQAHYVFFTNRVSALQPGKGDVVLLRREPLMNPDGVIGRYVIFWNGKEALPSWMPESEVQQMLPKAGITLPIPQGGKK